MMLSKLLFNPWVLGGLAFLWLASTSYVGVKAWNVRGAVERAANLEAEKKRLNARIDAANKIISDMEEETKRNDADEAEIERQLDDTRDKLKLALTSGALVKCPWTGDDDSGLRPQGNRP